MMKSSLLLGLAMSSLMPAAIAAAPDTEAVEYFNVFNNHYFVTATASEAGAIDRGDAGPGWLRTGRSFQAWLDKSRAPVDALPVCRFYSAGANSHFYTASSDECEGLKRGNSGWAFEGIAFHIQVPANGECPVGTVAMMRAYNDGFRTGEGANHRFVDDPTLAEHMAADKWIPEGAAFCAAAKPTGTNANLTPTTTRFEALAGTWKGEARWKVPTRDQEPVRAPLELTLAAGGGISGSGQGCTFAGSATMGDGFRSLFTATVTASGCTDAAFNGEYRRIMFQRFGPDGLMVKMKRGEAPFEAAIDAWLSMDGAPPAPPSIMPPQANVEGSWTGTVRWHAVDAGTRTDANKPLDVQVSSSGAVTGSGFGCTLTGTLGGSGTLAGCEEAAFNGTYALRLRRAGSGRMHVQLHRELATGQVQVEGMLVKA